MSRAGTRAPGWLRASYPRERVVHAVLIPRAYAGVGEGPDPCQSGTDHHDPSAPAVSDAGLGAFLVATGKSVEEAQVALVGDLGGVPRQVVIGEAELELKAAIRADPEGKLVLSSLSLADVRRGDIAPQLLSTVRVRMVRGERGSGGAVGRAPAPAPRGRYR